ncbi:hypothetical protein [Maribacter sp. 2307ULW6-5]|uniref:hypothetical protein n=1 Tax=Maribacter sp. 2307ULW6-5 TaxID=3386275 RepID=UPI0039BD5354
MKDILKSIFLGVVFVLCSVYASQALHAETQHTTDENVKEWKKVSTKGPQHEKGNENTKDTDTEDIVKESFMKH